MSSLIGKLELSQVSKVYGRGSRETLAVNNISFSLERGEIGILLGPSGCGKSTVLRMVAGLESRTSGNISVSGKSVNGPGRERGLVFQAYTSFPWLTVERNVAFGLRINGAVDRLREGVVDYFLEAIGLSQFRDQYPDQLSGGMRQRVAIARALANEPDVLLLDEPFGALDPETRRQMQQLVVGIVRKERMTVLMVTHDVDEALYMGDRIAFLSRHPGELREWITPTPFQDESEAGNPDVFKLNPTYSVQMRHILEMMREESVT